MKLRIKYCLLTVAKVLDFVSWHHNYVYQHLANCMKSRTEETRRFPFIPLSVSDWLIRKDHPIRDEQTAFSAVRVGLNEKSALINQIQRRI